MSDKLEGFRASQDNETTYPANENIQEEAPELVLPEESSGQEADRPEPKPDVKLDERERIALQRELEVLAESGGEEGAEDDNKEGDTDPGQNVKAETPPKIKVKVDGEEREVDLDKVLASYQKGETGDKRLKEAAEERQRLQFERQQLEIERQQLEALRQQKQPEPENSDATYEELKKQRKLALEIGDTDEFERIDEEISRFRVASIPNPNDIVEAATQRAIRQIQYNSALEDFKAKNTSIVSDPVLYNVSMSTFEEMCKSSLTYQEAFEKTGKVMKEWIDGIAGQEKASNATMATRQARKDTIPNEPGRVNARTSPPPAQKEPTASDIVNEMRQARGLPV
jgi:hypothetical protein